LRQEVRLYEDALRSSERRLRRAEQQLKARPSLFRRPVGAEAPGNLKRARDEVASVKGRLTAAQAALHKAELTTRGGRWPETHSSQLDRLAALDGQIRRLGEARGRELTRCPPTYLVAELGEPTGSTDRIWQQAAGEIESYRARWGIEDQEEALPTRGRLTDRHREVVRDQLIDLGYAVGVEGIARS
jgi:hypothetical protein